MCLHGVLPQRDLQVVLGLWADPGRAEGAGNR